MSSSGGTPISYKPQVNRAITKRWAEAKQISYEGNDWGDEDDDSYESTPSSARGGPYSAWPGRNPAAQSYGVPPPPQGMTPSNRSFTNPSPAPNNSRSSFDRGDDRRNFSSHAPSSSFEGPYPTARHNPFPEPQHDWQQPPFQEPSSRAFHGQPPLHIHTQSRPQSREHPPPPIQTHSRPQSRDHPPPVRPPSRDRAQYRPGDVGRRSESSGRPSMADLQGRSESPFRTMNPPMSARSQHSRDESPAKRFPPRKDSLSQDSPGLEPSLQSGLAASGTGGTPVADSTTGPKPLPFIRPADIYKRMEEEREKERRSQESSRPSIDSNASRPRERDLFTSARQSQDSSRPKTDLASGTVRDNRSPARVPPSSSLSQEQLPIESKPVDVAGDTESSRKLKSTLDPVAERKSEYGFENMLKEAGPDHPSSITPATSALAKGPSPLSASSTRSEEVEPLTAVSASSNYSERPDLVTASSHSSERSLPHSLPIFRGVSDFGPDFLDRPSARKDNLPAVRRPATEDQDAQYSSSALSGTSKSPLHQDQDNAEVTGAMVSDSVEPEMRHNPSVGLRSMVHQGFDESQDQVPQTPLSITDSVVRSNSASASDISPIISRAPNTISGSAGPDQSGGQHPSIAAAMHMGGSTPTSLEAVDVPTLQDTSEPISEPVMPPPPPPPVKDGYRRDYSVPSPGNSQARTPLTVGTVGFPEAETASKSSATPTDSQTAWRALQTASEDPRGRENQTKTFGTNVALKNSPLPTLPTRSDALAASPTRGTVRELAEKLESRSGRASPAISLDQDLEVPRPLHARLDSFRPALPGGWQSYSTTGEIPSRQQDQGVGVRGTQENVGPTHTPGHGAEDSPVSSEDEDIPTAGPPKPRREESDYGPTKTAFAAAAAAGSALLGAFSSATGLDTKNDEAPRSYDVSDDESATTNPGARDDISTKDFANVASTDQDRTVALGRDEDPHTTSSIPPSPPAKDTPSETDIPDSTLGYFPPPLRTSKVWEMSPPPPNDVSSPSRPSLMPALSSETSMRDTENDRLRKEIVRSLTPKSTRDEGESAKPFDDDAPLPPVPVANPPHSSSLDNYATIDPENNDAQEVNSGSYQTNQSLSQAAVSPATTNTPLSPLNGATPVRNVADLEGHDVLKHRFSWEPQQEPGNSNGSPSAALASPSSPVVPQGNQGGSSSPETIKPYARPETPTTISSRAAPPLAPADTLRHVQDDGPLESGEPSHMPNAPPQRFSTGSNFKSDRNGLRASDSGSLLQSSARETPFRDILSLATPQDRIQAFNANRTAVASQDTGLEEWLRALGNQSPEHSDILRNNGRLSAQENDELASFKQSPARNKFQRLTSLANATQSSDPEYDPSTSNSPSGGRSNNLHMPVQGKKLLKDAGKIGGQAGVVAKGLFAKGKNKLRAGGGGSDKASLGGRRRSSQPMIVIDEPQHSSVTTNTAPQIPNLNISPIESEDQWYKPIDAATSSPLDRSISPIDANPTQESNHQDVMLSARVDQPEQHMRQSSPRVSAVGSFHDGELPSRSISEVTRPTNSGDERSPVAPIPEDSLSSAVTENLGVDGARQSRAIPAFGTGIAATSTRHPSAPVSDALGPLPNMSRTANTATNPVGNGTSGAEQDSSLDQNLTAKVQDEESRASGVASYPFAPPQSNRHSVQSAIPSHGSRFSSEHAGPALPNDNGPSDSARALPSNGDLSNVPDTLSRDADAATPPYAGPQMSKEAEAAMYRSPVDSSGEGLPAYESNLRNPRQSQIDSGAAIVPVADLSQQRRINNGAVQSRPFSFVGGGTMILPGGQTPGGPPATSSSASTVQPDLAKEISVAGSESGRDSLDLVKRKSKSYSRPFITDPNVRDHPAYKQSQELVRNKETFIPDDQNKNTQPAADPTHQTVIEDGRYRIPGPYVQEYRSPKQPPQPSTAKPHSPTQVSTYEQPPRRPAPGMDPLRSHDPRGENQVPSLSSPANHNAVLDTGAAASPITDRSRQHSMGGLFRTRSKSRSVRSRNDEYQKAETKNEKRGGFFKQRSKGDGASVRNQFGNSPAQSRDGLNQQMSRDSLDPTNGESADHVGMLNSTRPHNTLRTSGPGNSPQSDGRKKRFSGLGSLFGRSGPSGMKTNTKAQGPQPVQRASTLSHYLLGKPDPRPQQNMGVPDTMYAQNQQRHQTPPQKGQPGNYPQPQPGPNVPLGGYYAPTEQQQAERSNMPHDPDSFSRGGFSSEQRTSSDQYRNPQGQNGFQAHQQGSQPLGPQLPSQVSQPEETRRPLQINTNTDEHGVRPGTTHHFVTAPPGPAPQLPLPSQSSMSEPRQVPYHSTQRATSPYEPRQGARPAYNYSGTPGTNQSSAGHAIDLHKRSRSPRNGRRLSDEGVEEVNRNDPANQLGTFSKSAAPRSGGGDSEQEAPWKIGLPNNEEEENKRKSQATLLNGGREREHEAETDARPDPTTPAPRQNSQEPAPPNPRRSEEEWRNQEAPAPPPHEPTVAEKVMGVQLPRAPPQPLQRSTSGGNANAMAKVAPKMSPVELPGSKAPGDDSDDEIVMSSTAYPGQEWAPESWGYGGGGGWDE